MAHHWKFFRAGGFDQVHLTSGSDLVNIGELDKKLWVALACPVKGLEFDARTLELLDLDKDGRIRAQEFITAASWMGKVLKNPDDLMKGADTFPLAAINDSHEEGQRLLAAAKAVLRGLNKQDSNSLSIDDVAEAVKSFDALPFNGDGVVMPQAADDVPLKQAGEDVITCLGPITDRSGHPGYDGAKLEAFFKAIDAHVAWLGKGEQDAQVMPLKTETPKAYAAFSAVRAKVDDYFARCRLAAFDGRAVEALNREEKEYLAIAAKDLNISASEVQGFPLARIAASKPLPLETGINPAWEEAVVTLQTQVVAPLLGARSELSESDWAQIRNKLAAHDAWVQAKAGVEVEKLGVERIKALVKAEVRAGLLSLVAKDKAEEPVQQSVASVEKLVRYHRDLLALANNFVSFRDFYSRKAKAVFQAGTLYLDQRSCDLCIRVADAAKHATMAPLSRAYIAYCDCTRAASNEKMTIAAVFSAGDSDNLMVGRNGLFIDREGKDWDATITKIVDNPISVRQAFWAPYKKLLAFVENQVNKRAAAADTAATGKLTAAATDVEKTATDGKPPVPEAKKIDIGTLAAIGVAVGGITTALGALLQAFFGLGFLMPLGILGLILAISGPSMAIAALKLRQRNLGPLLDANGWAVNAAARVNIPFGGSLTQTAELPSGSERDLRDPFEQERTPWGFYFVLLLILAALGFSWWAGRLDSILPDALKRGVHMKLPAELTAPAPK